MGQSSGKINISSLLSGKRLCQEIGKDLYISKIAKNTGCDYGDKINFIEYFSIDHCDDDGDHSRLKNLINKNFYVDTNIALIRLSRKAHATFSSNRERSSLCIVALSELYEFEFSWKIPGPYYMTIVEIFEIIKKKEEIGN